MESADVKYFERLCDSLGFICIAVNPDLRIRYWNRQAVGHFGKSTQDIAGQSILEIIEPPERKAAEVAFRKALDSKTASDVEIKYHRDTDHPSTFVLIVSPIVNDGGECIGASAAMRDISQRKRLSQELSNSRRMASLGNMAGGVAHHFNNILGGMMTSIDCALPSDSPRELRKTLRLLAQAIGRANRITKQLAAFAESENEHLDESSELGTLVDACVERLQVLNQSTGIDVVARIEPVRTGLYEVMRLRPVLESLTQNAMDAMPSGGALTVELKRDGEDAVILISDTGCGISKEAMEHIFEPFFTTKGELGGGASSNIGLGLAAVHGLVSEMGGSIKIESAVGKGTTVTLRLPLRRTTEAAVSPEAKNQGATA